MQHNSPADVPAAPDSTRTARSLHADSNGQANGDGRAGNNGSAASRPVVDLAGGENADYIADQYDSYLADPASVGADWQAFFAGFALGLDGTPSSPSPAAEPTDPVESAEPVGVFDLVHTYRELGHFEATLDPLAGELGTRRGDHAMLSLDNFSLEGQPDELQIGTGGFLGDCDGTLGDLIENCARPTAAPSASSSPTSPTRPNGSGSKSRWSRRSTARD